MRISDLNGKNVCILGFGREGQAMLKAIEEYAPQAEVTIADKNDQLELPGGKHWHQVGTGWLINLEKFDVIIKSPGIPPQPEIEAVQTNVTSSTNIFLDSLEGTEAMVIGITGAKGKSTTAKLIYEILRTADKDAHLVGNIGDPAIAHLHAAKRGAIFVLELSSYQLMDCTTSPHIAVVTSFFPEHLDYHGSLEAYLDAKKHIARFQDANDVVVFAHHFHGAVEIAKEGDGRKIPFGPEDCPVALSDIQLIGEHNLGNIAGAFKVAERMGVPAKTAIAAIVRFKALPHRLQPLGTHHGIEWVDDAISTTPESATAAINALEDRVKTIIVGGQDRGLDFTEFGRFLARSSVENVIVFPGSGPRIREAAEAADEAKRLRFFEAPTMKDAVRIAKEVTRFQVPSLQSPVPIVLLSTASPSYGMFKNFEEKGDRFKEEIFQN
jgi:UDP-N-acetylmuramoyl-L-alanine---L-glutamate ligase